jgi:hypothetical protein
MSFINKSVNYSQTNLLKAKLKDDLIKYNEYYKNNIKYEHKGSLPNNYHVLLTNNNKYYMYSIKRKELENCKEETYILYFFKKTGNGKESEFYMEVDDIFNSSYLFEGYIYNKDCFLISDILVESNRVIEESYSNRQCKLNNIIKYEYKNINNLMNINIHPVFKKDTVNNIDSLLNIFKNNFVYNKELVAIEEIYEYEKIIKFTENNIENSIKRIVKGKIIDVYNVINVDTGDAEGILYIKGLKESKYFNDVFYIKNMETIEIECEFNKKFYKWSPCVV